MENGPLVPTAKADVVLLKPHLGNASFGAYSVRLAAKKNGLWGADVCGYILLKIRHRHHFPAALYEAVKRFGRSIVSLSPPDVVRTPRVIRPNDFHIAVSTSRCTSIQGSP